MKTCPICGASTFDDSTTCFGCLHRFDLDDEQPSPMAISPEREPSGVAGSPQFLITLDPVERVGGFAWSCSVQPVSA